jgi:integrase/recombinase XerD
MSAEVATKMEHPPVMEERLIGDFLDDCKLRGMTAESIRSYRSNLLIYHSYLKRIKVGLLSVDRDELRSFLTYLREERKVSHKRVENYFTSVSSLYEYLAYEGYIASNPVPPVRKRYLRSYKKERRTGDKIRLISVEEMGTLINSITDVRDRAIVTLLAKTGIRRGELMAIDLEDIDWEEWSIELKARAKRSNRTVFFDEECAHVLRRWLRARENTGVEGNALFPGKARERIDRNSAYRAVTRWASLLGLHDENSGRRRDHFTPHCCRHWFTTHLRRAGMPREYIQELRGDKRKDAIDVYDHIDRQELRRAYLAYIPKLFTV